MLTTVSLRARIAIIAAAAVAAAVLITSVGLYVATARTLEGRADRELVRIADELVHGLRTLGGFRPGPRVGRFGGAGGFVQLLGGGGEVRGSRGTTLPVSERAARVAGGADHGRVIETADAGGVPVRILTTPLAEGALQVALPVADTVAALADLRRQLLLAGVAGSVLAAGLGLLVARRAVRPVQQLTELAESVAATGDLTRRIDGIAGAAATDDELGRLSRTFNTMLANLEEARAAQQQLVADASHELRTPLTSLRTNIEVLAGHPDLDEPRRAALIRDVTGQLEEFGRLVDGLVELARGAQPIRAATPVRLDQLVAAVVDRFRTFARQRPFVVRARPSTVTAEVDRLERAVANLLDNALKYGHGAVEVAVGDGTVTVRDHGPGIAEQHLPHVFDRFYRSPEARSAPGSGLGLSIVQQVAQSHGGAVEAGNAPDGGAVFTLRLPASA